MAKRELIEKNKVKKLLDEGWDRGVYPRNDIMLTHTHRARNSKALS